MGRLLFIVFFLLDCLLAAAQARTSDTMTKRRSFDAQGLERLSRFTRAGNLLLGYDPEAARHQALSDLERAKKERSWSKTIKALVALGFYEHTKGENAQSIAYFRKALQTVPPEAKSDAKITPLVLIGNVHRAQGSFDSAQYFYAQAIENLQDQTDRETEAFTWNSIGQLHLSLGDVNVGGRFIRKAFLLRRDNNDSLDIADSWKSFALLHLRKNQFDSAKIYLDHLMHFGKRFTHTETLIFANIYSAEWQFLKGNFLEATYHNLTALDSLGQHDYVWYQVIGLRNLGQIFEWQGEYSQAMQYLLTSLRLSEKINDRQGVARTNEMIAWAFVNQNNWANAREHALLSYAISRKIGDDVGRSNYYVLSGFIAHRQKQYDRALLYFDSALTIRRWFNVPVPIVNVLNVMVQTHIALGNTGHAVRLADEVYALSKRIESRIGLVNFYNLRSEIAAMKKDYDAAERYSLLGLSEAQKIGSGPQMKRSLTDLSAIYTATRRYYEASKIYEQYIQLTDSMYNQESAVRQAQSRALYELEKRERQIALLNERARRQDATLALQQKTLELQTTTISFGVVGLVFLGLLGFVLYRYYREKKQANDELNLLNEEVTRKNIAIESQARELREANKVLGTLNHELIEKKEEILAQAEELIEANEIINDINRDLETIIQKRTSQLKEAYLELDTFFYRSSHDFRRPLTTFMGLAEVAKVTVKEPHALELFEKVKETAKALDKMLIKLHSISDVGSQEFVYKPVLLEELFTAVCDTYREEIQQKGIWVSYEIQLKRALVSYPAMVKIILENLLENSINFSLPGKPSIALRAWDVNNEVYMEFADNGQGIASQYHDRVFDMYFRASERSKGNGLGLFIVKKAITKLNGTITFTSAPGLGTTFVVVLPNADLTAA